MDSINLSNKLIRVEYPGIVKNVDNMLATLGGITAVSEVGKITTSFSFDQKLVGKLGIEENRFIGSCVYSLVG